MTSALQKLPHGARRLRDPLLVLDEREAPSPKPTPGLTATFASCASRTAKSSEPAARNGSGIGAQTNIVPRGGSTSQPARPRPVMSASRRLR